MDAKARTEGCRPGVLRGGVLGRGGQGGGVAAERPPQVKPVDDHGGDGAADGGDGDHKADVAEDPNWVAYVAMDVAFRTMLGKAPTQNETGPIWNGLVVPAVGR